MSFVVSTHASASAQADRLRSALSLSSRRPALASHVGCLMPLLTRLQWRGDARVLAEALPHFAADLDLTDLRNVLGRLGYRTRGIRVGLEQLDPRLAPCLYVTDRADPYVILRIADGRARVFDGSTGRERTADTLPGGTTYLIDTPARGDKANATSERWLMRLAGMFRPLIVQALVLTGVINALTLAVPLSIMVIYNQVIGRDSQQTLVFVAIGVIVALIGEYMLRVIRARIQAHIGARVGYLIGGKTLEHILHLPPSYTERAAVGAQVARLKEFESLREFFTSPMATLVLELPFLVLFLAVVAAVAGPLAWVPVGLLAAYGIVGLIAFPPLRSRVKAASKARAERHGLLIEALSQMRQIKQAGAEDVWRERFRAISGATAWANFRAAVLSGVVQNLVHMIMVTAGVATLWLGALRILDGAMSTGALIAAMMLIWRVLSPLQTGFNMFTRLEQIHTSAGQLQQLLAITPEREVGMVPIERKIFAGGVAFHRVSLRYNPQDEPALMGVSFRAEPGEIIALTGAGGSGKTSVLKLVLGLYRAQAGIVTLDGVDIRQLDPIELRQAIAYVPQRSHKFFGTIAQNLRLANPIATDAELQVASALAGALETIEALPKGFDTRIDDRRAAQLPPGFYQRLALARGYVRDARVMLLDEPAAALDELGDQALTAALHEFRGRRTILLTTHRPSHMRLADRVLVMKQGQLIAEGPPDQVLDRLGPTLGQ